MIYQHSWISEVLILKSFLSILPKVQSKLLSVGLSFRNAANHHELLLFSERAVKKTSTNFSFNTMLDTQEVTALLTGFYFEKIDMHSNI